MNNQRTPNWGVGICHYTGKLVNRGFYLQGYSDKYFSTEELLVKYIREIDEDANREGELLTDDFLLEHWYDKYGSGEGYYYSVWDVEDAKYIEIYGIIFEVTSNHEL